MSDDNVIQFPTETVDRVARLANAIANVIAVSEDMSPADYLTALMLIEGYIQQQVSSKYGLDGLRQVLVEASEKRRRYEVTDG